MAEGSSPRCPAGMWPCRCHFLEPYAVPVWRRPCDNQICTLLKHGGRFWPMADEELGTFVVSTWIRQECKDQEASRLYAEWRFWNVGLYLTAATIQELSPTTLKELRNAHSGGSEEEAADSSHSILRNAHSGGSEEETVDSSHSIPRNALSGGSEEEAADSSHSIPRQSYLESME